MAEPPKAKRPSWSKKAPEPDFSPFEDWLIDGPVGDWPEPWDLEKELTEKQKQVVVRNIRDLGRKDVWLKKVQLFESALAALANEVQQKDTRAKYHIRFDRHQFPDVPKDLSGYPFPCSVSFCGASFGKGSVSFNDATFDDGYVSFFGAEFGPGDVSYRWAKFSTSYVWFSEAKFAGEDVSFEGATFNGGDLSFTGTKFSGGDFSFKVVNLRSATMHTVGMVVAGNLTVQTSFPKSAKFNRIVVNGTASFSGSSFGEVPDFCDAKFDRPPEVADMFVPRPKLKGWSRLAADPKDVAKFRKLKAMALAANDHEKDGEFFAGEMLAKRGTETTGFFGLLFNSLYWWLSDFGQSFVRPLVWLGVSFLSIWGLCLFLIRDTLTPEDRLWFAADFSFRNMLPLFGSLFRFAAAPKDHISWYQKTYHKLAIAEINIDRLISLGIGQNLVGTVLLFLFLLALRNKFRLK